MSAARWFDTDTELRELREPPAKPAKVANVEGVATATKVAIPEEPTAKPAKVAKVEGVGQPNFSGISDFSGGVCGNGHFLHPGNHGGDSPDSPTLAGLVTLAVGHTETVTFHTDARESIPESCRWNDGIEPDALAWLCPHCGQPASIDDVFPSLDGERTLTMWHCEPCQVVAVTPDTIRQPPSRWGKRP